MSENEDSISRLIAFLKEGDDQAADEIWRRYFARIIGLARKKLGAHPRRMSDEEDIAVSVFDAFFQGARHGRFPELNDRSDLWKIIAVITTRKVVDRKRKDNAQKRGGTGLPIDCVKNHIDNELTPEEMAILQDLIGRMMDNLDDVALRDVVKLELEGYSKREIAKKLDRCVRTIERKHNLIVKIWEDLFLDKNEDGQRNGNINGKPKNDPQA